MSILHLVTDGRLIETIHLQKTITRQNIQANRDAINRLGKRAIGPSGIIICDVDNMEIGYIEVDLEYEDIVAEVNYDKIVMLTFIVVVTIGYMLIN